MKFPGFANIHSHTFQYAIAGLTEHTLSGKDSFWTWRQKMYKTIHTFTPEKLKDCAVDIYRKMLENGYLSVGEFHYLHHQPNGKSYSNPAIMSETLIEAALETGIQLTLLPVLYTYSDFDQQAVQDEQLAFYNDTPSYLSLLEKLLQLCKQYKNIKLGIAFHSLRACSVLQIQEVLQWRQNELTDCPVHIHISEQQREVEQCLQVHKSRPIDYLFQHISVDENWTLIHATHANTNELLNIADSKAIVGLCPTTEANLGDGIFPLKEFIEMGGRFSIGSDSQVNLNPFEEIKLLEYSQRLALQQRSVCTNQNIRHPGFFLWKTCSQNGFHSLQSQEMDFEILIPEAFKHYSKQQLADLIVFTNKIQ